jgi:hypothetical protein
MNNNLYSKDNVSICHKDNCIHASGQNANLIALGAFAMFLLIGIAAIAKNN